MSVAGTETEAIAEQLPVTARNLGLESWVAGPEIVRCGGTSFTAVREYVVSKSLFLAAATYSLVPGQNATPRGESSSVLAPMIDRSGATSPLAVRDQTRMAEEP